MTESQTAVSLSFLIGNKGQYTNGYLSNTLYNELPVAVYTCDSSGYITSYNTAAEKLWGRKPVVGVDLWCGSWKIYYLNGDPMPPDLCPMARTLKEGIAIEGEEIIVERPDGVKIKVKPFPAPPFNDAGILTGAINTLIDVTKLTEGEEKQAMLAAIVNTSDDAIMSKTLAGMITSWNKAAERMFGYTEVEVLGKHISIIIPPTRIREEDYIIGEISKGNKVDHFQTIRIAKDGHEIPISLSVSPIADSNGRIIGASKIARDISEQQAAEEAARRYTERLETINTMIETVSEEMDLDKILQKVTDATTGLTGAKFGSFFYNTVNANDESLVQHTFSGATKETFEKFGIPQDTTVFNSIFFGDGIVRSDDITKDPRYGKNSPYHVLSGGNLTIVSYLAVPVISREGAVIGGLIFGHTEPSSFTKEHESIVSSIAAQAAIGIDNAKLYEEIKILNDKKDEFIGLASHELKTPLTSISGYLQILNRLITDERGKKFIDKTIQQTKKLTSLVTDLLDVSKIEAGKMQMATEKFRIRTVVEDAIELIQQSNNDYQIILKNEADNLMIHGDPHRLEQVMINLLTNAIKYSPGADKIEVSISNTKKEMRIGVKDYGLGIPRDKLLQIFSRFFRIEGVDPSISGLGIGLYISHQIITRHKGKIWVESELGKGSTFWFTLPV